MPLTPGDELARLLAGPGATAPSGGRLGVPLDDLRVQVEGVGALGRPVTRTQADKLSSLGTPAPYGRGEETLVDSTVRHTWQIPTGLVEVDWGGHLGAVLEEARTQLGLPPESRLEAELHSMLVYEKGQFFLPHQDSEKEDAMVATLVLTLPTIHQGGELVVHEGDGPMTYPASRTDPTLTVMYADRLHEVLPVRSGHRISLTYNLILAAPAVGVSAPDDVAGQAALLLDRHFTTRPRPRWTGEHTEPPQRYAYLLDHMYTQHGLTWAKLKGVDIGRVALLRAAAERTDCEVALALAEITRPGTPWIRSGTTRSAT